MVGIKNTKKAIFLDRDGVLNIPFIKNGKTYAPKKFQEFKLYPNVKLHFSYQKSP